MTATRLHEFHPGRPPHVQKDHGRPRKPGGVLLPTVPDVPQVAKEVTLPKFSVERGLSPKPKGWTREQVEDAELSLKFYQGGSYGQINSYMREGANAKYANNAHDIRKVMDQSKLSGPLTVYRGIRDPEKTLTAMGGKWADDMTGQTLGEKSFLSTSKRKKVADDFTDLRSGVVMEIRLPAGIGAISLGGRAGAGEAEVLAQDGLKLRVVEDRKLPNGKRYMVVEASP